jgi:hypothetical protein
MRTIAIHHHFEDTLAAEVIAGALLTLGQAALSSYPPGPQRVLALGAGDTLHNVVLWTQDAADSADMEALLRGIAIRRQRCLLLVEGGLEPPTEIITCPSWPMYDRSTPWVGYRRALRGLFDVPEERTQFPQPTGARAVPRKPVIAMGALPGAEVFEMLTSARALSGMALAGILLWALTH